MQNYYEVLEVSPGARPEEIERAYRLASATWAEGSLALYSLFEDADAAVVRERVRDAYQILSDERARRAYDAATFETPPHPAPASGTPGQVVESDPLGAREGGYDDMEISLDNALEGRVEGSGDGNDADFDGARLRRARMHRGVELEEIGRVTKVMLMYLQAIEDEAFDILPAAVYVRGFVTAYARAIGLDPTRVAESYMPRFEAARNGKDRGRLLGRR